MYFNAKHVFVFNEKYTQTKYIYISDDHKTFRNLQVHRVKYSTRTLFKLMCDVYVESVPINIFGCWLSLTNSFILKQISTRG